MPGPVVVVIQYCQCVYRNPQTAKLEIGPACQRHIGVIFADMEIDYDKLAAAILRTGGPSSLHKRGRDSCLQVVLCYKRLFIKACMGCKQFFLKERKNVMFF